MTDKYLVVIPVGRLLKSVTLLRVVMDNGGLAEDANFERLKAYVKEHYDTDDFSIFIDDIPQIVFSEDGIEI